MLVLRFNQVLYFKLNRQISAARARKVVIKINAKPFLKQQTFHWLAIVMVLWDQAQGFNKCTYILLRVMRVCPSVA